MTKKIYVAHPLIGSKSITDADFDASVVVVNRTQIEKICQKIAVDNPDVLILSPVHMLSFANPFERLYPLAKCMAILEMADELWVYGDWQSSEGCRMEVAAAKKREIPVRFFDADSREVAAIASAQEKLDCMMNSLIDKMREKLTPEQAEQMAQSAEDLARRFRGKSKTR